MQGGCQSVLHRVLLPPNIAQCTQLLPTNCTLHTKHCTLDNAHPHIAHCKLHPTSPHTTNWTLHTTHIAQLHIPTLHTANCTLHTAHCTLHTAHYTHCTLAPPHIAHCTLKTTNCTQLPHIAHCTQLLVPILRLLTRALCFNH